jgi:phytoene synthase
MRMLYVDVDPLDLQACKRLLREGSKSFALASLLLPRRVRDPAAAIYAFCRVADDLVDEGDGGDDVLDRLKERIDRAYDGVASDDPVDRAFSAVVRGYEIPREIPLALLEGFAWDAKGRRYDTIEDVLAYSARVAGTVGVMMTLLMGPRDSQTLERACDLGVAMQLTNIARDVGQDARLGRVYLPSDWLRQEGVDRDAFLRDPAFRPEMAVVLRRLLALAEQLYARSEAGIDMLPPDCRPAIRAARLIYAEIGRKLERSGLDSVSRRTVVSKGRKLWLVFRALVGGSSRKLLASGSYVSLEETRFLVEASARPRRAMVGESWQEADA